MLVRFNAPGAENKMTTMKRTVFVWLACTFGVLAPVATAHAQYGTRSLGDPAVGEKYKVEVSLGFWSPEPELTFSSESLGIVGTPINAITDLGFQKENFRDFRLVLRPTKKLKFRIGYTPIKYEAETTFTRTIVFNGQRYDIGLPVTSTFDWKDWRFGLEYDFLYKDRGYLGFITEAKYTDAQVMLASPLAAEFTKVKVPVPTIGAAGRVYLVKNLSVTGELTGLKLAYQNNEGTYVDLNIYGTFNFTNNVGVQGGYRTLKVDYIVNDGDDTGNLRLKGLYFGGVARF